MLNIKGKGFAYEINDLELEKKDVQFGKEENRH